MSRATAVQDPSFLGHQAGYAAIMRQDPQQRRPSEEGSDRPSRLLQMREDYQRRIMKEKEERMVNMYETQQKKNQERAERLALKAAVHEDYPNSRLRQPGYMQQQQQQPRQTSAGDNKPSVRDFFRERREMETNGGHVPPINQHFKNSQSRSGSGHSYQKNSAGVDRSKPLAPIQHTRQGGISSAPAQHPAKTKPHLQVKHNASSPDLDVNGHLKANQRGGGAPPQKKAPAPQRGNPRGGGGVMASPKAEKLSDFQKWQMEQNKAREERLKKLNMRAGPPDTRESRDWGRDYEYEDEGGGKEEEEEKDNETARAQEEEIRRREQEILQRIAQQQQELDRLRREREEAEELERQEAEALRKQQALDRERRQRQAQEEASRRRQELAQARREEEEQQRAARAKRERQRFETHLDLHGAGDSTPSAGYASQLHSHRDKPSQPNSYRENPHYNHHDTYRDDLSQPNSYRGNRNGHHHHQPDSDSGIHQAPASKFTPKPPPEGSPRKAANFRSHQQSQQRAAPKRSSLPAEEHDEVPVPGPGVDFYASVVDDEQPSSRVRLVACKHCGRKFAEDRLQKHQAACKNAQKKREAFDPTQMRTDGTDMAKYIAKGTHLKEHKTKKKADWRQQHREFITNIRYAKQVQQMEQQGVAARDLPPPPPSQANHDLVPCPHCGRTFNETAAERHIPRCQELKTRPAANAGRRRR